MGKYKSIEIKGLFFEDYELIFKNAVHAAAVDSNLSKKQFRVKLSRAHEDMTSGYADSISSFYLEKNKFKIDEFLNSHYNNLKIIVDQNRESFIAFILYMNACVIIFENIIERVKRKRIDLTLKLNISLYGLIIRRAQEILELLMGGFVDGAMIIWRSMYENVISLLTLAIEDSSELTQRFYDHAIRNSNRKIISYNENYEALKFKPLPKRTHNNLIREKEKLTLKYGKNFLENDYGWADILFKGKTNFKLLESKVEMSKYRPYYVLCSEQIHSNFNGFRKFMEGNKIMLPKLVSQEIKLTSIIDPMQFTLSILHEVNDYIIWEFSINEERLANITFLRKMLENLQNTFKNKSSR